MFAISLPNSRETYVEHSAAVALVQEGLHPKWQFPDETVSDVLADTLVALKGGTLVGCVGFVRGEWPGINIVAVSPSHRRRGIGSLLVSSAVNEIRGSGLMRVAAGGVGSYLWPGVPENLPSANALFKAMRGWQVSHVAFDMTRSVADYGTPAGVALRAARASVRFGYASEKERAWLAKVADAEWEVGWGRAFAQQPTENILVGRAQTGEVVAALIAGWPGVRHWARMLGDNATTIGCVGTVGRIRGQGIGKALVAKATEELRDAGGKNCHIGWTTLASFYGRLGFQIWRSYAMTACDPGDDNESR
jgi:predicted N-acetyltransferase YhbS